MNDRESTEPQDSKSTGSTCSDCGSMLYSGAVGGLCPRCLAMAFQAEAGPAVSSSRIPSRNPDQVFIEQEPLGCGGMGVVFSARDEYLCREVAVKRLRPGREHHRGARERFLTEARIASQLEHPGIVPVYQAGVDAEGKPFYAMRRVRGISLAEVLRKLGEEDAETIAQHPLGTLLNIFQKVCDAVAYAHSRGVIHRDLKPGNVMLGQFGEVFVVDWGLAKFQRAEQPAFQSDNGSCEPDAPRVPPECGQTMDGTVLGSIGFMAPENAAGRSRESDARSDIFSLGAILYSILTLHSPIQGETADSMLRRTQTAAIRPPSDYNDSGRSLRSTGERRGKGHCPNGRIPNALSAIAMKALAGEPRRRYQTVKELQADITAFQDGYAPSAEQAGFFTQWRLLIRRNKTEFALSASALAVIALLLVTFVLQVTRTLKELRATAPSFVAEARALTEQGDLENALEKIRYAKNLVPREPEHHYLEGNILQALTRLEEARNAYAKAVRFSPQHESARRNLELCDYLLGGVDGSGALPNRGLERLWTAMVEQGRLAEAVVVARRLEAGQEETLRRWKLHLESAGFPGTLTREADGNLHLDASRGDITDLAILKGMPLSHLNVSDTSVSDLTPLRGMPLRWLDVQNTLVENLEPVQNLPLEDLIISRSRVTDLTPLRGMGLLHLIAQELPLKDLSPLKGMPLRYINAWNCRGIADLKPLEGMRLHWLDIYHSRVDDVTPLRDMPLSGLNLSATRVSDLSPLKGMPLRMLELDLTPVSDLRPLSGMPLTNLVLRWTPVRDIEPLAGMPLKVLTLDGCRDLEDVAPLVSCPELEYLSIPSTARGIPRLRELTKLKKLSYTLSNAQEWNLASSADEFWKDYGDAPNKASVP